MATDRQLLVLLITIGVVPLGAWQYLRTSFPTLGGVYSALIGSLLTTFLGSVFAYAFYLHISPEISMKNQRSPRWLVCALWSALTALISSLDSLLPLFIPSISSFSSTLVAPLLYVNIGMGIAMFMYLDGARTPQKNLSIAFRFLNKNWKPFLLASLSILVLYAFGALLLIVPANMLDSKDAFTNLVLVLMTVLTPLLWTLFPMIYVKLHHFPDAVGTRLNLRA